MTRPGTTSASRTLQSMRTKIAGDSPVLAANLIDDVSGDAGFSDLFDRSAPETDGAGDYRLALEYIFEGYLLHYGSSRLFAPAAGEDFRLLAGDYMYARGLDRVTARGDLASIRLLSELIDFCSLVHCEGLDAGLAADAWVLTTLRVAEAAGGDSGGPVSLPRRADDPDALKRELDEQIDRLVDPGGAGEPAGLRDELCNIYSSFNRQRRQDGP